MSLDKKYLRVEMPDGKVFAVPVMLIAHHRADYYGKRLAKKVSMDEALAVTLRVFEESESEIRDWAENDMDWSDVMAHAVEIQTIPPTGPDYEDGWANGPKAIITLTEP